MDVNERYNVFLKRFKEEFGFVSHQIESFNEFVDVRIQKIVSEIGEVRLESEDIADFAIRFGRVRVEKPMIIEADGSKTNLTPQMCRIRNLTYSAPVFVEVIPIFNGAERDPVWVKLIDLPVMLKSKYCVLHGKSREELIEMGEDPDDPGGYFIVNGTERVVVAVEEVVSNRPIIDDKDGIQTARINSEVSGYVQKHIIERKKGLFYISYANVKKMPAIVLLRALGLETDKEIIEAIADEPDEMDEVYLNIEEFGVRSSEDAKKYIQKRLGVKGFRAKIGDVLDKYLLPHLGQTMSSRSKKAEYLAYAIKRLIKLGLGKIEPEDIDHYANKRLRSVADLFEVLLRSLLLGKYGLLSRVEYAYQKVSKRGKTPNMRSLFENEYITERFKSHMATGQWVGGRTGVCQRLERSNFVRTHSHLRNVVSPLSSSQEHFEARTLHPTQWGRLCAEETPEGVNIGLRKYLAHLATISVTAPMKEIRKVRKYLQSKLSEGSGVIIFGGEVLGTTKDARKLAEELRELRRKGEIHWQIGISYIEEYDEVRINYDAGRVLRPLIVVKGGKPLLTDEVFEKLKSGDKSLMDLIKDGVIEFIDAEEEENAYVALYEDEVTEEHTHLEVHPSVILGLSASLVPFPEYNRGDRVNFGAKMHGQSLGLYAANFLSRVDTKADLLIYPQVPLIKTPITDEIGIPEHPQGHNLTIAVMSFYGYNMEDAIIINKAAIERGMGRSIFFRTYETEERRYWRIERDEIRIPPPGIRGYLSEEYYANLDEDGIISPETHVNGNDVLIGKVSPLRFLGSTSSLMSEVENRRESSEKVRSNEKGIVDRVFITETEEGNKLVKVVVRDLRIPELGDKFASRYGQKGVVGLIVPEEDMPFNSKGMTPDVIVNPHGIPSRLTVGQLIEMITNKLSSITGIRYNPVAFTSVKEPWIREQLRKEGFREDGREVFYDPVTGEKMEAEILMAPLFYQKLHHMVANKIHARARGPVTLLTKQPTEGRAKEGGLRLGEMEKDCLIAHGAALLLHERFSSDAVEIPVCRSCGLVATKNFATGRVYCPVCGDSEIDNVTISYAFKLMLDELKSMGLYPKINVE